MKEKTKNGKLINENTENGDERQPSEDRKSLISIIDDPTSNGKPNHRSGFGNSGHVGHVSTKPNIRLSDSFI